MSTVSLRTSPSYASQQIKWKSKRKAKKVTEIHTTTNKADKTLQETNNLKKVLNSILTNQKNL